MSDGSSTCPNRPGPLEVGAWTVGTEDWGACGAGGPAWAGWRAEVDADLADERFPLLLLLDERR